MLKMLYDKRIVTIVSMFLLLTLAACGGTTQSTSTSTLSAQTTAPVATPTSTKSNTVTATPVPQNNPSSGPMIILTPTPAPGGGPGSQQVTFPDRILIIGNVSQQSGVGNSTPVSLALTIKNTSAKPILNQATFFQLVGSQGDIFGYQSSVTPGFYGTIPPNSSHNGTVVFLVPTGAMSGGLRLLYRSEIDAETVFVRLQIS
ncbi:MAG TPA: DUF4352 domain-containing protein [Ktedonobacteraceae bacterium]|nr:DUF4352 domain-containing protein [Ktedonobacteraceae bacterium]